MSPRVWIGKGIAPCRLVVDCPHCGKPAEVKNPDTGADGFGEFTVACLTGCRRQGRRDVEEAILYWKQHQKQHRCGGDDGSNKAAEAGDETP